MMCSGTPDFDALLTAATAHLVSGGPLSLVSLHRRVRRIGTRDQAIVVKVFSPEEAGAFRRERLGATAARDTVGPIVPVIVETGTLSTGHRFIVYPEIRATSLQAAVNAAYLPRLEALGLLGQVLSRFHRSGGAAAYGPVDLPPIGTALELMVGLASERAALLAARSEPDLASVMTGVAARLEESLDGADGPLLCHGDLHLSNVLGDPTGTTFEVRAVVDYESVILAFPEYDLAKTVVVCSASDPEETDALLAGYGQPVSGALLADLVVYHSLDGWLWSVLVEGRDRRLWSSRLRACLGHGW